MIETLGEDYIRTARAKGQVEIKILFRHALKNAAAPIVTVVLAVAIAVPLGVVAAYKRGSLIDRFVMGFSVPVFVVSYLLIYLFSIKLAWLPVQGYIPISQGIGAWAERIVMPVLALALVFVALIVNPSNYPRANSP